MISNIDLEKLETDVYWLALSESYNAIQADMMEMAESRLGSMSAVWKASPESLRKLGFHDYAISEFFKFKSRIHLYQLQSKLQNLRSRGVSVIKYTDPAYPKLLRGIPSQGTAAPLVLFHRGSLLAFDRCAAIVGTRVLSYYGHVVARRLARSIAEAGYTIVSGLARGADTEAHCGALEAKGGRTVAVLAWLDPLYPPENSELLMEIEKRGAVLAEHYGKPLGKRAAASFVERNRITSGISRCVVVVESDEEGGTVHQVHLAIRQGREVFAVKPKSTNTRAMRGFRAFVKLGSTPISSARPVLDYLRGDTGESMDVFLDPQRKLRPETV